MRFLLAWYEEDSAGVEESEASDFSETVGTVLRSELAAVEYIVPLTTSSTCVAEKLEIVHKEMQSILDGLYKFRIKGLRWVVKSGCYFWICHRIAVTYIMEGMSGVHHGNKNSRM